MTGAATGTPVDAAMQVLSKSVSDVAKIRLEEYHVMLSAAVPMLLSKLP
jgi:hypothetical protein